MDAESEMSPTISSGAVRPRRKKSMLRIGAWAVETCGRRFLELCRTLRGLTAFALISLSTLVTKLGVARVVIGPMILRNLTRSGLQLTPMILFLAAALGLVIIGQTVSLLTRVGAQSFLGTILVTVVVRELGPLITVLVVLARAGTANVIELATSRAVGEVEALEALGIDPIHYLVVPRLVGMALGVFALSVYFVLGVIFSGYLWAFLQNVPLTPAEYFRQIASALTGLDFVLLAIKTSFFGAIVAVVTCYHGLARPLQLEEISRMAVRAAAHSVIGCMLLDSLFIMVYLLA